MKSRNQVIAVSLIGAGLAILASLGFAFKASPNFAGLRAEYSVEQGDIGIPGITKMYDGRLVNGGRTPARIEICAFVDDAGGHGEAAAFSVQKYDPKSSTWITVVDASDAKACRPYPLAWVTAELKSKWLWPNKWVSIGEEATAARGFHKGESARFVLFTSFKHSNQNPPQAIPTPAFVIDEEAGSGAEGLRIRH